MKKLAWFRRPYFAKTILEVGGGHDPYEKVTHAVDKFPNDNTQRAGHLRVQAGVDFREGDLEAIPFSPEKKFDFIYTSHVIEHVNHPEKAVEEMNRVAKRGYLATPSPLREQLACPFPFEAATDFHLYYCWTGREPNTLHVIRKSADRIGEYCHCSFGQLGRYLFYLQRKLKLDLEPFMPRSSKETALFFQTPLKIVTHQSFTSACLNGNCAYRSASAIQRWTSFPLYRFKSRFRKLHQILKKYRKEFFELEETSDPLFDDQVLRSTQPCIVAVWAKWSGASQALAPTLARLSGQYPGKIRFLGLDVDENSETPLRYSVQTIPSLLLFKNGKLVTTLSGNQTKETLMTAIEALTTEH